MEEKDCVFWRKNARKVHMKPRLKYLRMCPEVEFSEYFNCNQVDESTARNDFSGPVKDYCNQRIS